MAQIVGSRAFLKMLKEAVIAYSFNFGGIFAGFVIASQFGVFQVFPWAIAIYPAILTGKGVIAGLLSGHLSTALHLGSIHPKIFGNTKSFYRLFAAMFVITLVASIIMSLTSIGFGSVFWGLTISDYPSILVVLMATMALGIPLFLFTSTVAFVSFKKGLDPDVVVYPIMSTVADIFITLCYVLVLNLFFFFDVFGKYISVLIAILPSIFVIYLLPRNIHEKEFVKTVKESFITLFIVAFIVNITGTVLHRISLIVENRREIYTVYPALIDMVGDVGSVVGSTHTTKLTLGLIKPSLSAIRSSAPQMISAWSASALFFVLFSVTSLIINGLFTFSSFLNFTLLLLTVNGLAVSGIILVSFVTSILTFKRGLDPDNFVIPIGSTLADGLTTAALLAALLFIG